VDAVILYRFASNFILSQFKMNDYKSCLTLSYNIQNRTAVILQSLHSLVD